MNINLHIERLVLDGVSIKPHQQHMFKATLETELGRLLTDNGIASGLQTGGAFNAVQAPSIEIGETNEPYHLGLRIARSIYGGINR